MAVELIGLIDALVIAKKLGLLDKLLTIPRKKHIVLVLGATGAGKTSLINSLTEVSPEAIDRLGRTEFVIEYPVNIEGHPFIFVDTPGQQPDARLAGILDALRRQAEGVINVVSYGYHEGAISASEAINPDNSIIPSFLVRRREEEIHLLNQWKELAGIGSVAWVLTAVSKADIWWRDAEGVLEHYRSGEYAQVLQNSGLRHRVVIPYSAVRRRFLGAVELSGNYEDSTHTLLHRNLLNQLLGAIGVRGGSR